MCGRFALTASLEDINQVYGTNGNISHLNTNYNIAPLSDIPVITVDPVKRDERLVSLMQWGLIPHWAHAQKTTSAIVNARAETISDKPVFKKLLISNRCIIPASGFFEWDRETRQPYYIKPKEELFAFAGLWSKKEYPDGSIISSCAIITVDSNLALKNLHDRMPVILNSEATNQWLKEDLVPADLKTLLVPYSEEYIDFYQVDKQVNNPNINNPSVINAM